MKTLATTLIAAGALGVAALAGASPAQAQYWRYHHGWGGPDVPEAVIGGALLGLGAGALLSTPPYQGPGTLAPYRSGPAPYYAGPPPAAYGCHYVRMRTYDEWGNPVWVPRTVCD